MIHVEGIGKRYRIGVKRHDTLRDLIAHRAAAVLGRARRSSGSAENDADQFWALKDVSFDVAEGEVVGIIGKNGAGKSTLLKIMSRITLPTEGRIVLNGRVASLLEVGTGFHPELTGRENIFMNGAILGMSQREIRGKLDEIVAFSEVEKFIDTPVKHYSSGMYVRLAFAVAAHLEPEILIVDEVLAVGDAPFQAKCFKRISVLCSQGRTILLVSHNLLQVRRLCQSALLLEDGRVTAQGETSSVVERYLGAIGDSVSGEDPIQIHDLPDGVSRHGFRFTGLSIRSEEGSAPRPGGSLHITVRFSMDSLLPLVALGIRIYDRNGIEVLRLGTFPFSRYDILREISGANACVCRVRRLPLVGGAYVIKLLAWVPGGETLAEVERAAEIYVVPANPYGGTVELNESRGLTVADHEWVEEAAVIQGQPRG